MNHITDNNHIDLIEEIIQKKRMQKLLRLSNFCTIISVILFGLMCGMAHLYTDLSKFGDYLEIRILVPTSIVFVIAGQMSLRVKKTKNHRYLVCGLQLVALMCIIAAYIAIRTQMGGNITTYEFYAKHILRIWYISDFVCVCFMCHARNLQI